MRDPDAPGGGFWHWWVANLPANTTGLPKGAGGGTGLPEGAVQPNNDFSLPGYGGPCPPKGTPHHYHITVYALDLDKLRSTTKPPRRYRSLRERAHAGQGDADRSLRAVSRKRRFP